VFSRSAVRLARGVILAVPLAFAAASDTRAEQQQETSTVATPSEEEALSLYEAEKLLTARTRAQAILDVHPDSAIAHFVLGSVLRDAEGSLPRSMIHLREAKRLFDRDKRGTIEARAKLGSEIVWGLMRTASLMDHYEEQLLLLDEYDARFPRRRPAHHAWPLMKLNRYDEARAYAREGIGMGDAWQEITGLNALCAIEGEDHRRQAHYDACKRALDWAREHNDRGNLAVHAHNASLGALTLLRFDEAERFALIGTKYLAPGASNPWLLLTQIYTDEGRADDAVAALREAQEWCAAQPPQYRDQKTAETFAVIAAVLLVGGDAPTGLHFITRAIERPDRRAVTSSHPEQSLGGAALLRRALLRLDAEQALERASARGLREAAPELARAAGQRASAWADDERAIAMLADDDRLTYTLRPYTEGALEPGPTWMVGDLVRLLGAGVTSAALSRARAADADHPDFAPYFDAVEAEIALTRGEHRRALDLATFTLDRLPRAEAILRARVAAVGADAAARAGAMAESLGLFERALAADPGVTRRLGVAIPARVEASGSAAAERAAVLLRRSPRLRASPSGFVVRIDGDERGVRACLLTASAASLGCGFAAAAPGDTPEALATRAADEFHRSAFAMKFSLTPTDLRSLDGSTTAAQGSAREALRGLLDSSTDH
jgi:tetratricopeptide (TPR) repeat protein